MTKRPRSITIISWIFIAVGCIALVAHWWPLVQTAGSGRFAESKAESRVDLALASVSGLLAAGGGVFMLHGFNWGRWLLVGWMGFHVVLSALHTLFESAVHSLLFAVVLYFLFAPRAAAYFRAATAAPRNPKSSDGRVD